MDITMNPVASSYITAVGYDEESKTMRIRFTDGAQFDYAGVSEAVYDALASSPSPGGFFHKNIRGKYQHTEVAG